MNWSQTTDPELRRPRRRQPGFFLGAPQLPAWLGSSVHPSIRPCTGRDVGQSDCAHRAQQPPGPGPAPHQCRRGLGRTPTAPAPAPQNVRHQPAWPRLGVGCGKGPPGPLLHPQTATGHRGNLPSGHRLRPCLAELPPALPCRCREPSFPTGSPAGGRHPLSPSLGRPTGRTRGKANVPRAQNRSLSCGQARLPRTRLLHGSPRSPGWGQDPLHPRGPCRHPAPPAAPQIPAGTAGPGS